MGESGEWDSNVRVVWEETPLEISEHQEGLYIFNLARFRPILNDLDLVSSYGKSTWREDIT